MPAEVLKDLAEDLVNGQYADKERAVAMLSSMTMYIDHHDLLLECGVLPALLRTVSSSKIEPTVSPCSLSYCLDQHGNNNVYVHNNKPLQLVLLP